jgi:putative transposase
MPNYRRLKTPGATYFFTVVTFKRQMILCDSLSLKLLRNAIEEVKQLLPFRINAWVLLPDHMHCLWTLPEGDCDYSKRWGKIKSTFTKKMKAVGWAPSTKLKASPSRIKHREFVIWQRRFWEHQIRSQQDFNRHCDYIHYNPVKHGLVEDPKKWEYSTVHRFIKKGLYSEKWCDSEEDEVREMNLE